ncbi:MAG: cob(I)yrinic acid a,c-diamide adenosyltransferase [Saprospiraceae bacterium]|nr:cob(I)yrinic acid a,c-diamide adenosyltransferase [Saprospiraceae bacterium]
MKIYTKTGDFGETSLFGGKRISKDDIRIEAYGTVDELNSHLGVLLSGINDPIWVVRWKEIQSYLFVIGSHLATDAQNISNKLPPLIQDYEKHLEHFMDTLEKQLDPLQHFVLPGGGARASQAHVCRTVCRRAERRVVSLATHESVDPSIIIYLNRLSDFLFVYSRYLCKEDQKEENYWLP